MSRFQSAFGQSIRCPEEGCGATAATISPRDPSQDDVQVAWLRAAGWQVVDGAWTSPRRLPEDRRHLPGAMGRRPNPHCTVCGDDRGGAYGHVDSECTWRAA